MIKPDLLEILRCPETRQKLTEASPEFINQANAAIAAGRVRNRADQPVAEKIEGALIREDGKFFYVIRQNIPVMLIDEAIALPLPTA